MSEMTFTRCGVCKGTLKVANVMVNGIHREQYDCPCTRSSTSGWSPTGVTERQLEMLAGDSQNFTELMMCLEEDGPAMLSEFRKDYRQKHAQIIPTAEMEEVR